MERCFKTPFASLSRGQCERRWAAKSGSPDLDEPCDPGQLLNIFYILIGVLICEIWIQFTWKSYFGELNDILKNVRHAIDSM